MRRPCAGRRCRPPWRSCWDPMSLNEDLDSEDASRSGGKGGGRVDRGPERSQQGASAGGRAGLVSV